MNKREKAMTKHKSDWGETPPQKKKKLKLKKIVVAPTLHQFIVLHTDIMILDLFLSLHTCGGLKLKEAVFFSWLYQEFMWRAWQLIQT